jgi:hypothetical protein
VKDSAVFITFLLLHVEVEKREQKTKREKERKKE